MRSSRGGCRRAFIFAAVTATLACFVACFDWSVPPEGNTTDGAAQSDAPASVDGGFDATADVTNASDATDAKTFACPKDGVECVIGETVCCGFDGGFTCTTAEACNGHVVTCLGASQCPGTPCCVTSRDASSQYATVACGPCNVARNACLDSTECGDGSCTKDTMPELGALGVAVCAPP